jgi:hypothetical protein
MPPHSNAPGSLPLGGFARASSWVGSHKIVVGGSTITSSPSNYDVLTSNSNNLMLELLMHIAIEVMFRLDMVEEEMVLSMDEQSLREFLKA